MAHSHSNKSEGHSSGNGHSPIGHHGNPKPPPGANNSYEKIREKIDRKDEAHLRKGPYTKEKMSNK